MSTSFFFTFGLLISFLLCISCSSIYHPVDAASYQEETRPYYYKYNKNDDDDIPLVVYPEYPSIDLFRRSSPYHPRASRNSWFRASTYQHMRPTGASEEKSVGDNLMRWG